PQRRMAIFAAQPFGPGLFLRDAAFLVVYLERPNLTPRALPRAKTGSGADAYETGTDPSRTTGIDKTLPCELLVRRRAAHEHHLRHPLRDRSLSARGLQRVRRQLGTHHSEVRRPPAGVFPATRGNERRRLGADRVREPG